MKIKQHRRNAWGINNATKWKRSKERKQTLNWARWLHRGSVRQNKLRVSKSKTRLEKNSKSPNVCLDHFYINMSNIEMSVLFHFYGIFCSFAFHFNQPFYLTHFYVFFVSIVKKVFFSYFKHSPTCDESSVWWKSINSWNILLFCISF